MPSDGFCTLRPPTTEERKEADRLAEQSPKRTRQPSKQYDRLLKGEITSKEYVKTLKKEAKTGHHSARKPASRRRAPA